MWYTTVSKMLTLCDTPTTLVSEVGFANIGVRSGICKHWCQKWDLQTLVSEVGFARMLIYNIGANLLNMPGNTTTHH